MKHQDIVDQQFGATAENYLHSAVHAQGNELRYMYEQVAARPQATVLDLGCGAGHVSYAVTEVAKTVCACDLSSQMLEVVRTTAEERGLDNITTRQTMAEQLPFADGCFDFVLSRMSAHHWRDVPAALREIRRVLKENGRFILVDIAGMEDPLADTWLQTIELLRDPSHVCDYTAARWQGMLERCGLVCTSQQRWQIDIVFDLWIKRMQTPEVAIAAIRHLQKQHLPLEVKTRLDIQDDGSFKMDVLLFDTRR